MPFHFSSVQVLWTLTFAALLVLLVVLLGRDRARPYPLFTFSVGVVALRLLVTRLLYGRLPTVTFAVVYYALAILAALAGVLVVMELARRAFAGAGRRAWSIGTLLVLAVAVATMWFWGPWPAWNALTAGSSKLIAMRFMELAGQRGDMLASLLAIELGILVAIFGGRFHARLRTHTQQIVLGLSVAAIAQLAARGIWQLIALKAAVHTQADYERVMGFQSMLNNANNIVYLCAVVWWIICLWFDEPFSDSDATAARSSAEPEPLHPLATGNLESSNEIPNPNGP